jgi:hypothetical protein
VRMRSCGPSTSAPGCTTGEGSGLAPSSAGAAEAGAALVLGRDLRRQPKYWAQVVTTPCPCSCWLCRPRKHAGDTMQERRAMLKWLNY